MTNDAEFRNGTEENQSMDMMIEQDHYRQYQEWLSERQRREIIFKKFRAIKECPIIVSAPIAYLLFYVLSNMAESRTIYTAAWALTGMYYTMHIFAFSVTEGQFKPSIKHQS